MSKKDDMEAMRADARRQEAGRLLVRRAAEYLGRWQAAEDSLADAQRKLDRCRELLGEVTWKREGWT